MRVTTTDVEGQYQFSELPSGRYSISVARNGYVSLQFGQRRPFEPGRPLDLLDGQAAEKIDFALPRGGVITGRITDESGEPLAGVGIRAMRYQYQPNGERRLMPVGGPMGGPYGIQTDDLGNFRAYGLMPGTYIVSATVNPMGGATVMPTPAGGTVTVTTLGGNDGSDGYATTYYPGTASEGEAQTITVGIGQETPAFFSMIPARLSRVSGIIRNSQGQPTAAVNFSIRAKTGIGFMFGGSSGTDGTFTMLNVPPGEYVLDVRPMMGRTPPAAPGAPVVEPEFASVPISVSGQDVIGLTIITGPGATISGTVVFDNPSLQTSTQQPSGQPLRVMFAGVDSSSIMSFGFGMDSGVVSPDGHFQLKGVNGRGTFRTTGGVLPSEWQIKSVRLEGVDITDTPHEVKPGINISGLEITLTNTQTTLSGVVRAPNGETVKDYVVAVFPSNLREGDIPNRFVRMMRPDQDGKYLTKGLPAGDYFASAVETLEQGEQWDPAFQDRVKPRARRFTLKEGQALALDLELIQ
jgi:hypothetical protein